MDHLTAYGPSEMAAALPAVVWELLNCGLATAAGISLLICVRYLAIVYYNERTKYARSIWRAVWNLSSYRLAVGFTIFLMGEWPRAMWVWWARYSVNHGITDTDWMGRWPWIALPIIFGLMCIVGKACIIRALIPMVWGRYAYIAICGGAILVVAASQYVQQ